VGGRSRVAAQFLAGQGFKEIYSLKGGIKAWQGFKAIGPVELNLDLIRGDETTEEMIALAFGMEEALRRFYDQMIPRVENPEVKTLLKNLAAIEVRHKEFLLALYRKENPHDPQGDRLTGMAASELLEGGFRFAEFLRSNELVLQTTTGLLDVAMMLETQSLDLCLRFAMKTSSPPVQKVLYRISDEEKAHLTSLGILLDQNT
jgi:sulfur-carrier protein adenylyltransferase/sulfurtransferase